MNEIQLSGMTLDSRNVKPGDLFIAVQGGMDDGRKYIKAAIEKGAVAVLCDLEGTSRKINLEKRYAQFAVPVIEISDLKNCIGPIAARFFDEPSKHLQVIGVTGTNGKTSVTQLIAQILAKFETPCGILGTLGKGYLNALKNTGNANNTANMTTEDPIKTQQALAEFQQDNTQFVAMEVTSHALSQARVAGVQFKTAIFTNLSRDHLDYHKDMEDYFAAKQRLFTDYNPYFSIINLDCPYGQRLMNLLQDKFASRKLSDRILGYGIEKSEINIPLINASRVSLNERGIIAEISSPWGIGKLKTSLLGHFNLSNLLAALTAVCLEGFPFHEVLEKIPMLETVPGRMMRFGGQDEGLPLVVIDYAHTPDALKQVLTALRKHCQGRLWCVFGCGGDRDRGKRPLMAAVAEQLSDIVIVTQDNPRTEDPNQIIEDILAGFSKGGKSEIPVLQIRKEAINLAISKAKPEDIVLIAGKGHEDYQIVGNERQPFSDTACAKEALRRYMQG